MEHLTEQSPVDRAGTVLVVDDSDANRYAVARILRAGGFQVLEAADAATARGLMSTLPDLVVLDVNLPDMHGFDFCAELKEDTIHATTPVLLISADATSVDIRTKGLHGGGDAYLTHPVHPGELVAVCTALVRAARAARNERGFQLMFNLNPVPCVVIDVGSRHILAVNDAAVAQYGYVREEFLALTDHEIFSEPLLSLSAGETGAADSVVRRHTAKNGSMMDMEVTVHEVVYAGRLARLASLRDVTERMRTERVLHFQAQLLDVVQQAVIATDPNGVIIFWNRFAERLYGWSHAEAIGRSVLDLTATESADDARHILSSVVRGSRWGGDILLRRRDGSTFLAHVSNSPILDDDGTLIGVIGISEDVSERRRTEEQLRQSQKMEAVGQLAAGVAHDFNNILTVVHVSSELLRDALADGDENHADLDEIQKASARGAALTRQLLAFSRQQVLAPQVLDLHDVIADVSRMLRRLIGEDVALALDLSSAPVQLLADAGQVEQVLVNLAVNARDAMPRGGTLTISTQLEELRAGAMGRDDVQPGRYVRLTVRDTGSGMTDAVRQRIFEPFYTTKAVGAGTGLGLATVDGIVAQSGGVVTVESALNQGSAFHVFLPLHDGPKRDDAQADVALSLPTAGRRVLVVEDEPSVRSLAARILRAAGYDVTEADNGRTALLMIDDAERPFDVILTDAIMPRMTGHELARNLAARGSTTPVVVMTGYTDERAWGHDESGTSRISLPIIQKPFSSQVLVESIERALRSRRH